MACEQPMKNQKDYETSLAIDRIKRKIEAYKRLLQDARNAFRLVEAKKWERRLGQLEDELAELSN